MAQLWKVTQHVKAHLIWEKGSGSCTIVNQPGKNNEPVATHSVNKGKNTKYIYLFVKFVKLTIIKKEENERSVKKTGVK